MVSVFSLQLKNIWLDLQQSVRFLVPWCLYISFSQTNQLGVYTLTTSPSPPSTKEHNTSQATFPLPHPSLSVSFSSPGSPLNHSYLPSLSLSIPMNAQSPVQPGLSWGGGVQGTHTPSPHLQKNKCPSQGVKRELIIESKPTSSGHKPGKI